MNVVWANRTESVRGHKASDIFTGQEAAGDRGLEGALVAAGSMNAKNVLQAPAAPWQANY